MIKIPNGHTVLFNGDIYNTAGPDKNNTYDLYKDGALHYTHVPYKALMGAEPVTAPKVGLKFDLGKPDLTLVTKELMEAVARGMEVGLKKYGRLNYRNFTRDDIPRFEAALLRHMMDHVNGELIDTETGLAHIDLVASNVNIIMWLRENK